MSNEQHPNPWSREARPQPWNATTPTGDAPTHQPTPHLASEQTARIPTAQAPEAQGQQGHPMNQSFTQPPAETYGHPQNAQFSHPGPQAFGRPAQAEQFAQVGPFGAPEVATKPRRKGSKRVAGIVAIAVLAAGVGGGAGFAASQLGAAGGAGAFGSTGVSTSVVQADASYPNWTTVAAAASTSVVAIDVTNSSGAAQGSGVIIDSRGYIVTNNHVVSGLGNATITVLLNNVSYEATIVGTDPSTDLAVIKMTNPPANLPVMAYGDNTQLKVGDPVMAIGNPLGLADTVTTGIVSALNRPVTTEAVSSEATEQQSQQGQTQQGQTQQGQTEQGQQLPGLGDPFGGLRGQGQQGQNSTTATATTETVVTAAIQTNAAINPGNSGGALVDTSGHLVGITSSIATLSSGSSSSSQSGNIGIGFAIGSDQVKYVVDQLIANGKAEHPQLGVTASDVTGTGQQGAKVASVSDGSGAASAGLQVGDVITKVNGSPVSSTESLVGLVRAGQVGKAMTLTIVRNGTEQEVSVTPTAASR